MKPKKQSYFTPFADTASSLIDPVLRKKAGISIELIDAWSQIVGDDIAMNCVPLKIKWRRRASQYDAYEPATLIIGCEGFSAMSIQHQTMEIIQKVNVFFGFHAIDRIKIEQKLVSSALPIKSFNRSTLDKSHVAEVEKRTADIVLEGLRHSLTQLGCHILSQDKIKGGHNKS